MIKTFTPGHFYSPLPDLDELDAARFHNTFEFVLEINEKLTLQLAKEVFSYGQELSVKVNTGESVFEWCNSQFPPADALAYYGMLRILKPNRIIEIGSGFSSLVAYEAIKVNKCGHILCIEPHPRDFLKNNKDIILIERKLQDTPDDIFKKLKPGDVLFIDSSHQVKCQSDVLNIFFRVLDLLVPGVFIHFHDIFYPDDYPYFWLTERGIFFNEQYFLLAFLKDNPKYICRLPNALIVRKYRETYEKWNSGIHEPTNECFVNLEFNYIKSGSFWIEKLA